VDLDDVAHGARLDPITDADASEPLRPTAGPTATPTADPTPTEPESQPVSPTASASAIEPPTALDPPSVDPQPTDAPSAAANATSDALSTGVALIVPGSLPLLWRLRRRRRLERADQ
jgi:hypothetical protein